MKQLSQRVTVKAALRPLTRDEASDYINYRSMKAGKGLPAFEEDAKHLIFKYSHGIPRLINVVSSRALMAAYVDGSTEPRNTMSSMLLITSQNGIAGCSM